MDAVFRLAETGDATALHEVQELQRDLFEQRKAARAHASELQTQHGLTRPRLTSPADEIGGSSFALDSMAVSVAKNNRGTLDRPPLSPAENLQQQQEAQPQQQSHQPQVKIFATVEEVRRARMVLNALDWKKNETQRKYRAFEATLQVVRTHNADHMHAKNVLRRRAKEAKRRWQKMEREVLLLQASNDEQNSAPLSPELARVVADVQDAHSFRHTKHDRHTRHRGSGRGSENASDPPKASLWHGHSHAAQRHRHEIWALKTAASARIRRWLRNQLRPMFEVQSNEQELASLTDSEMKEFLGASQSNLNVKKMIAAMVNRFPKMPDDIEKMTAADVLLLVTGAQAGASSSKGSEDRSELLTRFSIGQLDCLLASEDPQKSLMHARTHAYEEGYREQALMIDASADTANIDNAEGWTRLYGIGVSVEKFHLCEYEDMAPLAELRLCNVTKEDKQMFHTLFKACSEGVPVFQTFVSGLGELQEAEHNTPDIRHVSKLLGETCFQNPHALLSRHRDEESGEAGRTCLHQAARHGYMKLGHLLINAWLRDGARKLRPGMWLLFLKLCQCHMTHKLLREETAIQRWMKQLGLPRSHIFAILDLDRSGCVSWAELLAATHRNDLVMARDKIGNTALHDAAEGGYADFCKLLIYHGANIDAQNNRGETPLHCAIQCRHEAVAEMLVMSGADVRLSSFFEVEFENRNKRCFGTLVEEPEQDPWLRVQLNRTRRLEYNGVSRSAADDHKRKIAHLWDGRTRHADLTLHGEEVEVMDSVWSKLKRICSRTRVKPESVKPEGFSHEAPQSPGNTGLAVQQFVAKPRALRVLKNRARAQWKRNAQKRMRQEGPYFADIAWCDCEALPEHDEGDSWMLTQLGRTHDGRKQLQCELLLLDKSQLAHMRETISRRKLLDLLCEQMPEVANLAITRYRRPFHRVSAVRGTLWYEDSWSETDYKLLMKGVRSPELIAPISAVNDLQQGKRSGKCDGFAIHRERAGVKLEVIWRRAWHTVRRTFISSFAMHQDSDWSINSSQLTGAEADAQASSELVENGTIVNPNALMYHYDFSGVEMRDGTSPTLDVILRTECMPILKNKWLENMLDHKWKSFAGKIYHTNFVRYTIFVAAFFLENMLYYGDSVIFRTEWGLEDFKYGVYRTAQEDRAFPRLSAFPWDAGTTAEWIRRTLLVITIICNTYFTYQESVQISEMKGLYRYFTEDGWNVLDFVQNVLVWLIHLCRFFGPWDSGATFGPAGWSVQQSVTALVAPLIWIKFLHFVRVHELWGPYIRVILAMFHDIFRFGTVFVLFLMGFSHASYVLQVGGHTTIWESCMTNFQLALGDWDYDEIRGGGSISIILFILFAWIVPICLLNMLIAIMSASYEKVIDETRAYWQLGRARVILSIQKNMDDTKYERNYYSPELYVLEADRPIKGVWYNDPDRALKEGLLYIKCKGARPGFHLRYCRLVCCAANTANDRLPPVAYMLQIFQNAGDSVPLHEYMMPIGPTWQEKERVDVRYNENGRWTYYRGIIMVDNHNGTYDVKFDNGRRDICVPSTALKSQRRRRDGSSFDGCQRWQEWWSKQAFAHVSASREGQLIHGASEREAEHGTVQSMAGLSSPPAFLAEKCNGGGSYKHKNEDRELVEFSLTVWNDSITPWSSASTKALSFWSWPASVKRDWEIAQQNAIRNIAATANAADSAKAARKAAKAAAAAFAFAASKAVNALKSGQNVVDNAILNSNNGAPALTLQDKVMKDELERCQMLARKAKRKEFEQRVTFKQRQAVANAMVRNLDQYTVREFTAAPVASPAPHLVSPGTGVATPQSNRRLPRTPLSRSHV